MSSGQIPRRLEAGFNPPRLDDRSGGLARTVEPRGPTDTPLCVDLDGTLVRTDTLLELAATFVKANPLRAALPLLWALRGPAALKAQLASRVAINPTTLPYNEPLLERLRRERLLGRRLVLVTGADVRVAERIAGNLGIFDEVLASDGKTNLNGEAKRDALVARYGMGNFDYAGNARADLPVWRAARTAIVVNAAAPVAGAAPRDADLSLAARPATWPALARALRPHQWAKNLLIFVPLLLSHRLLDAAAVQNDLLAFVAFSLCASGIYLVNDLFDLESDRAHRSKCRRPLACGDLAIGAALVAAPILVALSLGLAGSVSIAFELVMSGYFLLTVAYSLSLKRIVLLDVVVLAALYASRIVAGAVAAGVTASFWLLAFALFMFVSLAMLKRYCELIALRGNVIAALNGRGYTANDADMIAMFGIGSGYIAVLVVALYIHGDLVQSLYANPNILWTICPILLYWISRTWLIAHRGGMNDDPILFVIKDRASLAIGALCLAAGALATLKFGLPF